MRFAEFLRGIIPLPRFGRVGLGEDEIKPIAWGARDDSWMDCGTRIRKYRRKRDSRRAMAEASRRRNRR